MTLAKLFRFMAGMLLACGIGLVASGVVTGTPDITQAGLISLGCGVGILLALSIARR